MLLYATPRDVRWPRWPRWIMIARKGKRTRCKCLEPLKVHGSPIGRHLPRDRRCSCCIALVQSTKFPSQLSTHLTRLVIHLHPVPSNRRLTHSPWTLNTSLPRPRTFPRSGAVSESPPIVAGHASGGCAVQTIRNCPIETIAS
jgi:hypothetical protein